MARYAVTILLGAFLLFQVQPLIGKFILPWFGGTPAVWTACMLVFQWLLLGGYAYAHVVGDLLPARRQAMVHLFVLVLSLASLPIIPNEAWRPTDAISPVPRILLLLTCTIGAPYFVLSTTGPLMQRWFSGVCVGRSPYRLYALSNAGSLLALLTYPFLFEPQLTLGQQAITWSISYVVFTLCCGWCALQVYRLAPEIDAAWRTAHAEAPSSECNASSPEGAKLPPTIRREPILYWLALSTTGSALLLATTNQICQEVPSAPFLWIAPLALYLVTFIICFDSPRWYARSVFGPMLAVGIGLSCWALKAGPTADLLFQLGAYLLALFAGCMTCHGELVRSRPDPRHLTLFYLVIAVGGALGGLFVAIIAPALFKGYWEYHISLAACATLALVGYNRDPGSILYAQRPLLAWGGLWSALFALCVFLGAQAYEVQEHALETTRNFYGVLRVTNHETEDSPPRLYRSLVHGRIMHGEQFLEGQMRHRPVSYYGPNSGVGRAIISHPRRYEAETKGPRFKIGVVGLGAGTLAAQAKASESITFYEINPEVVRLAETWFTYLEDSSADKEIILGDARTQMQLELDRGRSQQFDVLAIDAFSSDAIPMHLLTREAFAIYRRQLRDDGILALHVSSHHVNLNPVVLGLAHEIGWKAIVINGPEDDETGESLSEWLLVTNNRAFLGRSEIQLATTDWPDDVKPIVWTDDFGSLWQVLGK